MTADGVLPTDALARHGFSKRLPIRQADIRAILALTYAFAMGMGIMMAGIYIGCTRAGACM